MLYSYRPLKLVPLVSLGTIFSSTSMLSQPTSQYVCVHMDACTHTHIHYIQNGFQCIFSSYIVEAHYKKQDIFFPETVCLAA